MTMKEAQGGVSRLVALYVIKSQLRRLGCLALAFLAVAPPSGQETTLAATPAGIPLDGPWKHALCRLATENLRNSAWGVSHFERDYLLATAAFLHDVGAFDMPVRSHCPVGSHPDRGAAPLGESVRLDRVPIAPPR